MVAKYADIEVKNAFILKSPYLMCQANHAKTAITRLEYILQAAHRLPI